jgi:SOS response regulatory protein OraA/RecX
MRLLARREHTVKELGQKLSRGGDVDASVVRSVIGELANKELVSDVRYASAYALDSVRLKPRARRRVVSELVEKGVPARTAAQAVDAVFLDESVDDGDLARRVAERYLPRLQGKPDETRWRRLAGHLQRRGFDNVLIYNVCRELLPEPEA